MSTYTIKDLEKLSGIKAHTLRIWEQRYGILRPERTCTNIRCYSDADLKALLNISLLNARGVKISKIAGMQSEEICSAVNSLWECCEEHENQLNALTIAMIDLDEERFEKIISRSILQLGLENTLIKIVYPFFKKIGLMWQTGSVNPAQEHFISNLIRQKILVAVEGQIFSREPDSWKFFLYLPEGELHEIGLLFAHYIIRANNHRSIYLGQSLPFPDLISACETYNPCHIFSIFSTGWEKEEALNYIKKVCSSFPKTRFLVSGNVIAEIKDELPESCVYLPTVSDLKKYLETWISGKKEIS